MKLLLSFDEDGYYSSLEIVPDGTIPNKHQYLADSDENISFHRVKLVDGELVEGKTEEEFLEESLITALIPSQEQLEEADFEIKVINLLSELEVI